MKTLNFAMALALMGGAAQAGTVFEVPINGGIARIQLDDDCEQSMCASLSWSENDRRQDRKEPAKPSARLKADPAEKLTPSGPAPATQPPAKASRESGENVAPAAAPALEPSTVASIEPSQPAASAIKTSAASPVGGEAFPHAKYSGGRVVAEEGYRFSPQHPNVRYRLRSFA